MGTHGRGVTRSATVFTLGHDDLQILDRDMKWTVEPGTYDVQIGASSEDIRLRGTFDVR